MLVLGSRRPTPPTSPGGGPSRTTAARRAGPNCVRVSLGQPAATTGAAADLLNPRVAVGAETSRPPSAGLEDGKGRKAELLPTYVGSTVLTRLMECAQGQGSPLRAFELAHAFLKPTIDDVARSWNQSFANWFSNWSRFLGDPEPAGVILRVRPTRPEAAATSATSFGRMAGRSGRPGAGRSGWPALAQLAS